MPKRQEAWAKIETLKKEQEQSVSELRVVEEEKKATYLKKKAELQAASDEYNKAHQAITSANYNFDTAIRTHEAFLYETYDHEIDEGINFFEDKLAWLRQPGRVHSERREKEINILSMTKKTIQESNLNSVRSSMKYCQEAIKRLEKAKLLPVWNSQILQELKAGLPSIDVYEDIHGEKSLGPPPPTFAEIMRPIDDKLLEAEAQYMKWKAGKMGS